MTETGIQKWLDKTLNGDSSRKAEEKTGVSNSTISRAKRLGTMEVQNIVQIARGYNLNVLTALVECEIITPEEANQQDLASIARSLPDDVFVWEFAMRLRNDPEYWATVFDNPTTEPEPTPELNKIPTLDELPEADRLAVTKHINMAASAAGNDELAEVVDISKKMPPLNPDGTLDVERAIREGLIMVADSSPWEPEPGDEDYHDET